MMRKRWDVILLSLATLSASACAQILPLKPDSKIDDVLDALDNSGKTLHSFSAAVKRQEFDDIQGTEVDRTGNVCFEIQANGDVIFHLTFDLKIVGKHTFNEKIEYQIENGWLTILDHSKKLENHIQLNLPGQKVNLFQLGHGQFPLPIGQDKKTVYQQFDVSKIGQDKDDPANTIHLMLKPKPKSQFAPAYSSFEVWVDLSTNMPVRIATSDVRKTVDTVNDLLNLKLNPKLGKTDLSVPPLGTGWKFTENPLPQAVTP